MTERTEETVIGVFLRMYRERCHMKQSTLAFELGVTQSYLSRLECGSRTISKKLIPRFILYFHIPQEYFIPAIYDTTWREANTSILEQDEKEVTRKAELLISLCPTAINFIDRSNINV